MGPDTDYSTAVRNMVLIGFGLGPVMPTFTLASQSAVRVEQIGVATSLTQFTRSIGGTLGTAIFGSLLINSFGPGVQGAFPPGAAVPPELKASLASALHGVFLAGSGVTFVGVLTVIFLREIPLRGSTRVGHGEAAAVASLPPLRPSDEPVLVDRRKAS
jgi:hypothetical protein